MSASDHSSLQIAFIGARGIVGTYSGIETYYEEVGSRLADKGHQVTAYCRDYFTPKIPRYRGIRVRRLPAVRTKHLETLTHSLLSTADSLLRSFDIIQFHAIGSAPLAVLPRILGRRTIVSVRGLDWQRAKWGGLARSALRLGEMASAHCPTATVVVSETLKNHYRDVHGVNVEVVPNAIDIQTHRPEDKLRAFGLARNDYLLYAGRVSPEKGVHYLLEALKPLSSDKKLVIAGGSSYSDRYFEEVRRMAWDGVLFLGRVGRDFMQELFSNCYAFIMPSAMEGLSIALLEAVSHGACIVTTDIPENIEVVGNAALVCTFGDVEALRLQLSRVLNNQDLVHRMREKSMARASELPNWDEVASRTEDLYFRLVERDSHSRQ